LKTAAHLRGESNGDTLVFHRCASDILSDLSDANPRRVCDASAASTVC
jgi:hypothetical protein